MEPVERQHSGVIHHQVVICGMQIDRVTIPDPPDSLPPDAAVIFQLDVIDTTCSLIRRTHFLRYCIHLQQRARHPSDRGFARGRLRTWGKRTQRSGHHPRRRQSSVRAVQDQQQPQLGEQLPRTVSRLWTLL